MTQQVAALARRPERKPPPVSFFEFWPGWAFYTPIVVQWIALGLRYGDFSLPTAANPHITTGGLCGESKSAILNQVRPEGRHLLCPIATIVARPDGLADAEAAMAAANLLYPLVAKPDIGCNGTGVRLIDGAAAMRRYLADFPVGETVLLQELATEPLEAGLFYIRHPDEAVGRLTSVTIKHPPVVTGDGRRTLRALIMADERARLVPHLYLERLAGRLDSVPAAGEPVRLVFVGNHCKGSIFRDGRTLVTPALTEAVDRLAKAVPDFHFGRIDVRFTSTVALRRGSGFRVIEINGVGSEATHVWDPDTRLLDAWRAQFFHYGSAFRIGAANRSRGVATAGVWTMLREWRKQRRLMRSYPLND